MKTCFWLLLLVFGLPSISAAADPTWVDIPLATPGVKSAFDLSSLTISGSRRTAWVVFDYSPPNLRINSSPVSKMVGLMTYDCTRSTAQVTHATIYGPNGESASESTPSARAENIVPDTIQQGQFDAVCAAPNKKFFAAIDSIRAAIDRWLR